ncbi:MAG TPA: AgmX/PglI C-terminal domain-containing protein, partial [Kofleriaceae bacterium]|nr:AgmX/PglI C-terminal domain-containing protein [Kofleriaceae bacterium]
GGRGHHPPPMPPTPPVPPTEDLTVDLETTTLQGTVFEPEGLPPPPFVPVKPARKTTLDRERAVWRKVAADPHAPLARKASEAQLLASLAYEKAITLPADAPARETLFAEARGALATVHDAAKDKVDRTTLEMAAALALVDGDRASARPYLEELVGRFAKAGAADDGAKAGAADADAESARAQLAFTDLAAGKDADAATAVGDAQPSSDHPDLAYVIAWVRFRGGDGPGAAAAIADAAAAWKDDATRAAIVRDYLIMSTRGGVPPADAADGLTRLVPEGTARTLALLELPRAYDLAGQDADADASVELVLGRVGAALEPGVVYDTRRNQAEYARKAGRIDLVAERWQAVLAAFDACSACADRRADLEHELSQRAYEQHTIYVTSGDAARKTLALALYRLYARLTGGADDPVAAHARELESAHAPDDGSQYHEAVRVPIVARFQEVLACYEARLQGERNLGGPLTVRLEVDQHGAVTGVTTEPARGLGGMASVAGCVEDRARHWTLPSRPRPGVARISLPFVLGALPPPG